MAVIGRIRQYSGLTVVFVGVALAAFVLGDFGRKGCNRRGDGSDVVTTVAGTDISYITFERAVARQQQIMKLNNPQTNFTNEEMFSLREQVWTRLVDSIVYYEQFEKLGLAVSVEEMNDLIYGEKPHQYIASSFTNPQTGQVDKEQIVNFFSNLDQLNADVRLQVSNLLTAMQDDALKAKYRTLLNKSYYAPTAFAEMRYNYANEKRSVDVVQIPYTAIPDSIVTLTDADYQKYYDEHKETYKKEETRKIEYVIFDVKPSVTDISAVETRMTNLYNELAALPTHDVPYFVNINTDGTLYDSLWKTKNTLPPQIAEAMFANAPGLTVAPYRDGEQFYTARLMEESMRSDSMDAEHILIQFKGMPNVPADAPTKEQAQFLVDSLVTVLKNPFNPIPFGLYALQFSKDPSATQNSGNLGRFADGAMVYPFNEAVQNGKKGDIVTVETQFGIHIIKVGAKNPPQKMVRVATIMQILTPSDLTRKNVYSEASKFSIENRNIEDFRATAETENYNVREMDNIQPMGNNLGGVTQARQVIRWAFGRDNRNNKIHVNDVSDVINISDDQFVVAALAEINPKGYSSMESQKNAMQFQVMRDKKGDMTLEKIGANAGTNLEEIANKFEGTQTEEPVQVTFNSMSIGTFGRETNVIGATFGMKEGAFYGPVKGMNGVYFIKETERIPAEPKEDYNEERTQMHSGFSSRASLYQTILREKADIKDNRHLFY
ncbi:MAG: SurA N-terminal domain-containing protein [Bacteroidales bacterium]|nr:SurA N-terminal domain-containing protein [Bacteroidales bacterium]